MDRFLELIILSGFLLSILIVIGQSAHNLTLSTSVNDETILINKFSIWGQISNLFAGGDVAIGSALFILSGIGPYITILVVSICLSTQPLHKTFNVVFVGEMLGKWCLFAVVLMALLVAIIQVSSVDDSVKIHVNADWGVYLFAASTVVSVTMVSVLKDYLALQLPLSSKVLKILEPHMQLVVTSERVSSSSSSSSSVANFLTDIDEEEEKTYGGEEDNKIDIRWETVDRKDNEINGDNDAGNRSGDEEDDEGASLLRSNNNNHNNQNNQNNHNNQNYNDSSDIEDGVLRQLSGPRSVDYNTSNFFLLVLINTISLGLFIAAFCVAFYSVHSLLKDISGAGTRNADDTDNNARSYGIFRVLKALGSSESTHDFFYVFLAWFVVIVPLVKLLGTYALLFTRSSRAYTLAWVEAAFAWDLRGVFLLVTGLLALYIDNFIVALGGSVYQETLDMRLHLNAGFYFLLASVLVDYIMYYLCWAFKHDMSFFSVRETMNLHLGYLRNDGLLRQSKFQ